MVTEQPNLLAGTYRFGYYGYEDPTLDSIEDGMPLGSYPIAYQDLKGNPVPVIYSEIDPTNKAVKNFLSVDPSQPITLPAVSMQLLAGNTYTIIFQHTGPIGALNFSPTLPEWISVLNSPSDQVILQIKTDTTGGGDYLPEDYLPEDYLTVTMNALVGCYAFSIRDGATEIFDFEFCIGPIAGIQRVCPKNSLNFAYLNNSGGYSTLILPCVWTRGTNFGRETTSVKSTGQKFRVEYRDVYDNYKVSTQLLSRAIQDRLRELFLSINTYLWNDVTNAYDIPIVIAKQNLPGYGNKFTAPKQSFDFSFDLANEIKTPTA